MVLVTFSTESPPPPSAWQLAKATGMVILCFLAFARNRSVFKNFLVVIVILNVNVILTFDYSSAVFLELCFAFYS